MSYIFNSQMEKIEVKTVIRGEFKGQKVLILHCDQTNVQAIHLLDNVTKQFLSNHIKEN